MAFQAPFDPMDLARLNMLADQQNAEQQQGYMNNIFGALGQLGGIAAEADDAANMLAGMDKTAMAMKDAGIIDQDTLTKYLNVPGQERSFLFQNFLAPQMGAYNAGRSAAAQRAAWDGYSAGQTLPAGARNKYGYIFGGP